MKHGTAAQQGNQVVHDLKELGMVTKAAVREPIANVSFDPPETGFLLAKRALELGQKAADSVTEHASEYYEKGLKKAKSIEKNVEANIRENKTWYLLALAGIGLLASAVLIRRRK